MSRSALGEMISLVVFGHRAMGAWKSATARTIQSRHPGYRHHVIDNRDDRSEQTDEWAEIHFKLGDG
jgi:hypothetical protein